MALYDPDQFEVCADPAVAAASRMGVTVEQARNLLNLADLLELPRTQHNFNMATFGGYVSVDEKQLGCGTVACALGHLPLTGVPRRDHSEEWGSYGERTTGVLTATWQWTFLFGGVWDRVDGSAPSAAARIRFLCGEDSPESHPEIQGLMEALRPHWGDKALQNAARAVKPIYQKYRVG